MLLKFWEMLEAVELGVGFICNCLLSAVFEEPEDPSSRSFFSEIISSISDVKFSHSGRYMMTRDYLSVKVWDLNMENRPVETYQVWCSSFLKYHLLFLLLQISNINLNISKRFMSTFEASFVPCMKMTASLTNLSAAGTVLMGELSWFGLLFSPLRNVVLSSDQWVVLSCKDQWVTFRSALGGEGVTVCLLQWGWFFGCFFWLLVVVVVVLYFPRRLQSFILQLQG